MQTCSSRSSHKTFLLSFKDVSVCSELSLLSQWDKSTKRAVLWLVLCMWMRMLSNTFLLCLGGDRNSSAKSERLAPCHRLGIWDNCWCVVATWCCLTSQIRGTQCSLQITWQPEASSQEDHAAHVHKVLLQKSESLSLRLCHCVDVIYDVLTQIWHIF